MEEAGGALALLEQGGHDADATPTLPGLEARRPAEKLVEAASAALSRWEREGIRMLSVLDAEYPANLRAVHDRPPLVFVAGRLEPADARSVAVIGARQASREGLQMAGAISERLAALEYTVISGLAAGIDSSAHLAALDGQGRSVAVIGTGLRHVYPRQNASLHARLIERGAVISQFWPATPPSRTTFPMRNALMSGMALANVIVEATHNSGARAQARSALAHGRPVLLLRGLLSQSWARELASRPGTHVVDSPESVIDTVARLAEDTRLTE